MVNNSRNNFISIAKAIGIILMVVGHSGCPSAVTKFIYLFHMPLFFVCSGYFFKEISNKGVLHTFYKKKIKGLYVPYLKWSILFLLLHNMFRYLSITEGAYYQTMDYIRQFIKLVLMTDYELLIRPFWFIKELFLASITIATFSFIRNRLFPKVSNHILLLISLVLTLLTKFIPIIPLVGDCSVLLLSIAYFYCGILIQQYKDSIPFTTTMIMITFLIVLLGSILFTGTIDMRFTSAQNLTLYFFISVFGILMVLSLSKKIEHFSIKHFLYYIGNHTMPILALNLLALKLGNLIKIWIYDLPINYLSAHTVIYEHNTFFWPLYSLIGVSVPLLIYILYNRFFSR